MPKRLSFASFSNATLIESLQSLLREECLRTADILEHLIEMEERKLYLPAAYPALQAYCIGYFRMSKSSAGKRIQAMHSVRDYPQLLEAIAEGKLHLTAINILAAHLTAENVDDWIVRATHRSAEEIRDMLAGDARSAANGPELLLDSANSQQNEDALEHPESIGVFADSVEDAPFSRGPETAPAPRRRRLTIELTDAEWQALEYAMALDSHVVKPRDHAALVVRALKSHVEELEKRRFAAGSRSRAKGAHAIGRYVPAAVRQEVWLRDSGQCTFTSEDGHRCGARERLEFDHAEAFARGGATTAANLRLRCRPHNQYEAELVYGRGFMEAKRSASRERVADRKIMRAEATAAAAATSPRDTGEREPASRVSHSIGDPDHDAAPWLRKLGLRPEEARALADRVEAEMPNASINEKVRCALKGAGPGSRRPAA